MISRHGSGKELVAQQVVFKAGEMVSREGLNDALGFMELMQNVAGVHDDQAYTRVAPKSGATLYSAEMAYGPRIFDQVSPVIEMLKEDPWARQAVIHVSHPSDLTGGQMPCTSTLQFLIRDRQLDLITSMRSWDVMRGVSYDVVFQGGLTLLVARCLDIDPGICITSAGSLHLYAHSTRRAIFERERRFDFDDGWPNQWEEIQARAQEEIHQAQPFPAGIIITEGPA